MKENSLLKSFELFLKNIQEMKKLLNEVKKKNSKSLSSLSFRKVSKISRWR